jgi:glycosyltransferase involved in cell wall biosynthesis
LPGLKVLLSAFSCGPGRGSEPGVGWNWVQQVSRRHEVWLLTSDEFQADVERAVPSHVHPIFIPSYKTWERLALFIIPGLDWLYYYWWQWKVYRTARKLQAEHHFDLAHHVTFVTWRAPTFLCLLPIPLIWGPIGGGGVIPRGLRKELGWKGRLFEAFRQWTASVSRLDPFVQLTMRRAATIIAANRETAELLPARYRGKVQTMLGIGMAASEKDKALRPAAKPEGFIILFVALLRPIKGGSLALKTLQRLASKHPEAKLVLVGRGSEGERLAALARELGVNERVQFLGGLSRPEVLGWMQVADALFLPSLRDSGGLVLLEAMAQGKPVVCLDLGGPGEIVNAECGFKIRPGEPEQVVSDLAAALDKLAANPGLRQAMGETGRCRVHEHFDWDKRGERMMEIYKKVQSNQRQK